MPNPIARPSRQSDRDPAPTAPVAPAQTAGKDELAVTLPDWDLLPPAEFLDRRGRR